MNRRRMIAGLGGVLTLGAARIASALPADEHTYKARRIRWNGWQKVPNQFVEFGVWVAHGNDTRHGQPVFWYATTFGVCDRAGECEVFDCSRPWRDVPAMPETRERDALKARALRLLYDHLEPIVGTFDAAPFDWKTVGRK